MSASLSRQVRSVLQNLPDALPPTELLLLVDEFVANCSSSSEPEVWLFQLEDDLQAIHHEVVDHESLHQTEIFLAVLYHLRTLLSSSSIISVWFDLVLRPALRDPKLPTIALKHAKALVLSALKRPDQSNPDKVPEFRRRLLDLFLLDALNDSSGDDVLEWAELDPAQRGKRIRWKENLVNILLTFGIDRPHDLMTEINRCFMAPSCRLQLFTFMSTYVTDKSFPSSAAATLSSHPLMSNLLNSLLLDNSSTVCTIGLKLLVNLCPIFAVEACQQLKSMLPKLLAILARILCWKERPPAHRPDQDSDVAADLTGETERELVTNPKLEIRADLAWERLEMSFPTVISPAPSLHRYFTILYYLFPCNVLVFLRSPVPHLLQHAVESPYILGWEDALDEDEIRSKSERLLRCHSCHPSIIWRDAVAELSQQDIWTRYDVARIASGSMMLDIRNATWDLSDQPDDGSQGSTEVHDMTGSVQAVEAQDRPLDSVLTPIKLSSGPPQISLQDMVTTSVALKSDLKIDIAKPTTRWPSTLFPTINASPETAIATLLPDSLTSLSVHEMPSHVVEAIASLQREVLLLRNELNFELWLSRENVKHIGRLYQDRILSRNAEIERQGLYNKLRKYRAQVTSLEKELREHKEQASSAKNKYSDWNSELGNKLREFREEKKAWLSEAGSLRTAERQVQALFAAQGKLLGDATKRVFELETEIKAVQPKIDRLHDYERQIEQFIKVQRLWDEDFKNFNARTEQLELMKNRCKQMELLVETYEKSQTELEEAGRTYRRHIQSLEAHFNSANKKYESSHQTPATKIAGFVAEKQSLIDANNKLREKNADLVEELEEMREMVELLKGQVSRKKGLISDPRASPTFG